MVCTLRIAFVQIPGILNADYALILLSLYSAFGPRDELTTYCLLWQYVERNKNNTLEVYMADKKRVALTIFVDENFWRRAKAKFGRSRDMSFQRVGENLLRAWDERGMPLNEFEVSAPVTVDPVLAAIMRIAGDPGSVDGGDPVGQAALSVAAALKELATNLLERGQIKPELVD